MGSNKNEGIPCRVLIATASIGGIFLLKSVSSIGAGTTHFESLVEKDQSDAEPNVFDFSFCNSFAKDNGLVGAEEALEFLSDTQNPVDLLIVNCSQRIPQSQCVDILLEAQKRGIELRYVFCADEEIKPRITELATVYPSRDSSYREDIAAALAKKYKQKSS